MQTPQIEKTRQRAESTSAESGHAAETQWLGWLHKMLPDVVQLMLFGVGPDQTVEWRSSHPAGVNSAERIKNTALSCVVRKRAIYLDGLGGKADHALCIPIQREANDSSFVLVMMTSGLTNVQQNTAVQLTQWAAIQLREPDADMASGAGHGVTPDAQLALSMLGAQQRHGTFKAIAFSLVNAVASLCGCARVSLGCHDGAQLRLVAMSGQSKLDERRKIARQLCALMQDTLVARRAIFPSGDDSAAPSLQAYYKSQGEHPLLSFVLPGTKRDTYVLVLERAADNPFVAAQADAIEQSLVGAASFLELARSQELSGRQRLQRYARESISNMRYVHSWSTRRWLAVTGGILLLLSFFIPVTHRVSADAFIEASDRQVLVAAQDGFILSAHARAGEEVAKGDLLAKIDGQELQLSLEKWRSEKIKNEQEYAQALAIHDRSELSRLRADESRINAEISLFEQQLLRSEVRAPFDGVLLDGDWTQSLGAPVTTGDVLFEIASAEQYRLVLEVDEHDIGYIKPSQMAELRMAALPTSVWSAELGHVLPVAVSEKGSSAFRVPAKISGEADALRPGMEGVGKVVIANRSMFWVYTHKLADKLRYVAWKVGLL